jgi:hypothetical protein
MTITPVVGMGCTKICGSDRYALTIVEIVRENEIICTIDNVVANKTKDNTMGHQNWILTPNPNGERVIVKCNRLGQWFVANKTEKGLWSVSAKHRGSPVILGERRYYYDWSF